MKHNAKKLILSIFTSLLLTAGFTQAAQTLAAVGELASGDEIRNVEAHRQDFQRLCEKDDGPA